MASIQQLLPENFQSFASHTEVFTGLLTLQICSQNEVTYASDATEIAGGIAEHDTKQAMKR